MSPLTCSLTIFLFLFAVNAQYTYFDVSGVLICPFNAPYREVRLMEIDSWPSKNEPVSDWVASTSLRPPHKFHVKGKQFDDPGSEFEMELWIRHNCTDRGNTMELHYDMGDFKIASSEDITYTKIYEIDIYNKGEED
ncbi:hypothetical protein CAEBREN_17085 [Caenorhabditis brenneri]|uniref:Transthyretin-like family protein n=1 Tax=Caenorhabditis brenneri TaxID=135651 RepID=G0NH85_CAEBE|nr:hypothetical protein CAEBREN_17085 [Caenorhabditis brenneri]